MDQRWREHTREARASVAGCRVETLWIYEEAAVGGFGFCRRVENGDG